MKKFWILFIFFFTIASIVYLNSLWNGFVYDDELLITDQSYFLRNIGNVVSSTVANVFQDKTSAAFYRPVLMFTYFLDYNLGKGSPFAFHLSNLIFHLINILLVFYASMLLFKNSRLAFLAALLFSIHPAQSEAVAWISGRNDPLLLIFVMLAFIFYIKEAYLGLAISFFLALMTKESAIIFPFAFIGYDLFLREKKFDWKRIRPYLYLASAIIVYLLIRIFLVKGDSLAGNILWDRFLIVPLTYGFYLKTLLFPANYSVAPLIGTHLSWGAYFLRSVPFLLLIFSLFFFWRRPPAISFGLWWGIISLLPVSGLIPMPVMVMEHRLYSAMFGFALVFAWVANYLIEKRRAAAFVPAITFVFLGWMTMGRNLAFKDPLSLWTVTVKNNPYSAKARTNLGAAYINAKKYDLAERELIEAIKIDPQNATAHYNLGYLYLKTGRKLLGKKELEVAAYLDPKHIKAHYNLGILALNSGAYERAAEKMEQIIGLRPDFVPAYDSAGDAFYNMGKDSKAIEYYEMAQKIDPKDVHSKMMLEKLGLWK